MIRFASPLDALGALGLSILLSLGVGAAAASDASKAGNLRAKTASPSGLTLCDVCAGRKCATVRVHGRCTVDKAVAALREAKRRTPQRLRHRDRAVTKGDFKELTGDLPAKPGRARAAPKHRPQQGKTGTASRLLRLHEKQGRSLTVREHGLSNLKIRPLDTNKQDSDDPDGKDGGRNS